MEKLNNCMATAEECEAALLAKPARDTVAGETERGRSQRLDAVWSGEPLGICKAHPARARLPAPP